MGPRKRGDWRRITRGALAVLSAVAFGGVLAAPASASPGLIYWSDISAGVQHANLDGSGHGGTLAATSGSSPEGVAIDAQTATIYWASYFNNQIQYERLDGTGGVKVLNPGSATVAGPFGVDLDVQNGRIYWSNHTGPISWAKLDGSGGGNLPIGSAPDSVPIGVAVNPSDGRIYWANFNNNTIAFANLDGTGGGSVFVGSATVSNPEGLAIDPATNTIYWANQSNSSTPNQRISYASLSGTGGGNLSTGAATVQLPSGVALDPTAGKIFWGNQGTGIISFASLDGSGGSDLNTTGSTSSNADLPALLEPPSGAKAPAVSSKQAYTPKSLSCSRGTWAFDLPESQLYRVPQSFSYRWTHNGAAIAGATSSSYTAGSPGTYSCTVTATNFAGSTKQTSPTYTALGKVKAKISVKSHAGSGYVHLTKLVVSHAPQGATIAMKCTGHGCPTAHRTYKKSRVSLTKLFKSAHLKPGVRVKISVTAPYEVGMVKLFKVTKHLKLSASTLCLNPGSSKPSRCTA